MSATPSLDDLLANEAPEGFVLDSEAIIALISGPLPSEDEFPPAGIDAAHWFERQLEAGAKAEIPLLVLGWDPSPDEADDLPRFATFVGIRFAAPSVVVSSTDEIEREVTRFLAGIAPRPVKRRADLALRAAWYLVVDSKADPDLLLHLDPSKLRDALVLFEDETRSDRSGPWTERLSRCLARLESKRPDLGPSPLWLEWMQRVHGARVAAAASEPTLPPQAPPVPPTASPDPSRAL